MSYHSPYSNRQPSWFDDPRNREKLEDFLASAITFATILGTATAVGTILSKILR